MKKIFVCFSLGIIMGTIIVCLGIRNNAFFTVYNEKYIEILRNGINNKEYTLFVLERRIPEILVVLLMTFVPTALFLLNGYIFLFGNVLSIIAGTFVSLFGIKGIALLIVSAFPHYILYIVGFFKLYKIAGNARRMNENYMIVKLFWIILIFCTGILFESMINFNLLQKFLVNN